MIEDVGIEDAEMAYAKINLALHVRARNADGYHDIETLFAFAADGDRLTATPAETLSLSISGPFGAALAGEGDNLVLRAARSLQAAYGVATGAALALDKRLPIASGIGGGSADAAAALRLLSRLWDLPREDARTTAIAASLGADVPACLISRSCRGTGRGDVLVEIDDPELADMPLLLVNPGVAVPTGPVFAAWDGIDRGALVEGPAIASALSGRNDLEAPARKLAPVIDALVALLRAQPGVRLARMSGSGATCFALFDDIAARDSADGAIAAAMPECWRLKTILI